MKLSQLLFLLILFSCNEVGIKEQKQLKIETPISGLDSVNVIVESKMNNDINLAYYDNFNHFVPLHKGLNIVSRDVAIKDEGKTRVFYFLRLCKSKNITFSNDSLGNWVAKTENIEDDNILNFFIYLVKTVKPRYSEMDVFVGIEYWSKSFLKNPKNRTLLIDEDFDKKLNFLSVYAFKNKLSQETTSILQKIIEYERIKTKLQLPNPAPIQNWDKSYLYELSEYTSKFQDDTSLFIPYYKNGASSLIGIIEYLNYNTTETSINTTYKTINDKFTGKTRDFLHTNLLILCKDKRMNIKYTEEEYRTVLNRYLIDCKTIEYKDYINESNTDLPSLKDGQLLSSKKQVADFNTLIQQNRITYIDFWASWCMPCRAEMPASLLLRAEYAKKGINFIYISTDNDEGAWLKAMKQIGLADAESYLLPKGTESSLAKQLEIKTIPRYVLVDKKGKIIDLDAYRPSDSIEIKKQFNSLLLK